MSNSHRVEHCRGTIAQVNHCLITDWRVAGASNSGRVADSNPKENVFSLKQIRRKICCVNYRLSDHRIRSTCRELRAAHGRVSGRRLREELRRRFGAVGKTERVFQIWREECTTAAVPDAHVPIEVAELRRRLAAAETAAAENLARAERAEYREQAHQDKWAMEVDRLRQELKLARSGPRFA
jgi:Plasmid replication region DNA-binding N-term